MKKLFTPFLIVITLLLSVNISAQTKRNNTEKTVANKPNYQRVASGGSHTLKIKNGTLWAWGNNISGQLGDGTTTQKTSAVQIGMDKK